ncbi:MAG TPA: 6-phosphogluconolactonase [Polyangia bacterium]|nr:6-phosphogluconolactonase [Polyangia bacterium]
MTTPPSSAPPPGAPTIVIAPDLDGLARLAADRVRVIAADAVAARGCFRFALAGGSTPRALYARLAAVRDLDWAHTYVFFGDERNVGPDDPQSNFRMARETLLAPGGVPPENVRRMRGEDPDLDAAARDYEAALGGPAAPPLDLALLGMGADGHTASLFPGTKALDETGRLCVAVEVPRLATRRLTLTTPVFLAARELLFLVAGADKAETLRDVLGASRDPRRWPSQVLLRRARPRLSLLFCDRAAASKLSALPNQEVS